jgi:hypothetical protein
MDFEGYSLSVPESKQDDGQYAYLGHGQLFRIRVANSRPTRCDVGLKVNGVSVGVWRLAGFGCAVLEHPADDDRRFTFYREHSREARAQGLQDGAQENGLIVATFIPEDLTPGLPIVSADWSRTDEFGYPGEQLDWSIPKVRGNGSSGRYTDHARPQVLISPGSQQQAGAVGYSGSSSQVYLPAGEMSLSKYQAVEIAIRLLCLPEPVRPRAARTVKTTGIPPRRPQ